MTPRERWSRPGRPGGGQDGFTLIELLVALTLLGLLSVMLVGGLRFGTRLWETAGVRGEALSEVEAVQGLLRHRIAQAAILKPVPGVAFEEQGMRGGPESLRFTAPMPAYVGVGGLYRFVLEAVETEQGRGLELTWQLYRPDRDEWFDEAEDVSRRTLVDGMESLRFLYFGEFELGEDPAWVESWEVSDRLPALVAVEIGFPEGDVRRWPTLVAAPTGATTPLP